MDDGTRFARFQNPNAAVDFLKLKSGNLLLVYNDSMIGAHAAGGRAVDRRRHELPASTRTSPKAPGDFAYPIAVQTADGRIHVVYTSDGRRVINHAVFSEDWLLPAASATLRRSRFHGSRIGFWILLGIARRCRLTDTRRPGQRNPIDPRRSRGSETRGGR